MTYEGELIFQSPDVTGLIYVTMVKPCIFGSVLPTMTFPTGRVVLKRQTYT